jgi:alpha-tubulin suppressor-like RCC1 family protein
LYTWGSGESGQLGQGNTSNCRLPTTIPFGEVISEVVCGNNCMFAIAQNGKCFAWGSNQFGQLGIDLPVASSVSPIQVPHKAKQIACGSGFAVLVLENGQVMSCGKLNEGKSPKFQTVPDLSSVIAVACGKEHVMALTSSKKLYAWGNGSSGQLGLGDKKNSNKPMLVPFPWNHKVLNVACGDYHTACIVDSALFGASVGKIFTWGKGGSGQLANGKYDDQFNATEVKTGKSHLY